MSLSIQDAARDAGDRPAIITAQRTLTFADAAREARGERVVIATPTIETILAVYAALEEHQPIAMIHAKQPADAQAKQRAAFEAAQVPDDTAFVLFTSGTTGDSRGVVLSRAAIVASARASEARFGWRDDDAWLLALPMAHAGGLSVVIRCLLARKPVVLDDELELIDRATLASFVPAQLATVMQRKNHRVRAILLGGAAAMPTLVADAIASGWPVYPSYGLTETFGQIATAEVPGGPLVLLPSVTVDTRDTVEITAPQLATSYLDGTPIAPTLVTSDLGQIVDGHLELLGRRDDVINSGGEKVHPLDIERVVTATPGVIAACAFGIPDERYGRIVACAITVTPGFDRAAGLAHWHQALAPHARPRRLAIVETLPALPSGKPDRRAIATLPTEPVSY